MSHKEGKGFFRRIRSPLEHRNTSKHDDKHRSSSTSVLPMQQTNGHKRSGSDDVLRIENTAYGNPDILNSTSSTGSGINPSPRSQSTIVSPGDVLNPPLPPRNPPRQPTKMNDESPVYVTPADTLQRGNNSISAAILSSNYTRTEPSGAPPSKSEKKIMEMHQLTMCQKQRQDQGQSTGQRVQSVIDNSEYSTPFNLIQQQKAKSGRNSVSGGSGRTRRVAQVGVVEDGDQIIPVLSPPPDRSQTTSPSSPLSTPSSEHEESGGGGGGERGGSTGGGDSDYDIPWDKKFKDLPIVNRPKRQSSGGKLHSFHEDGKDHAPPPPMSRGRRDSPPSKAQYNRGYSERNSPPAPPERSPTLGGTGGPIVYHGKGSKASPQPSPEDAVLSGRPRYLPSRHQSEQHRPRDGSTSPSHMTGRPYGHTVHGPHVPRDLPPEISPRTSSMSIPHMAGRRLPSPPRERSESSPVGPQRILRAPSPPNPVHIDFTIPLCDQP